MGLCGGDKKVKEIKRELTPGYALYRLEKDLVKQLLYGMFSMFPVPVVPDHKPNLVLYHHVDYALNPSYYLLVFSEVCVHPLIT